MPQGSEDVTSSTAPPLAGYMNVAAGTMQLRFEQIQRAHRGEQGHEREDTVRDFLRRFLPSRLAIASGEVVSASGEQSGQLDIIIYDEQETPLFDADQNREHVVVPVEGVYAVIEVSSSLDKQKLSEDAAKLRVVKQMSKEAYSAPDGGIGYQYYGEESDRFPVYAACFGYTGTNMHTLAANLAELDDDVPIAERVDSVVVLPSGVVISAWEEEHEGRPGVVWSARPTPESARRPFLTEKLAGGALMWFYAMLANELAAARTAPIALFRYAWM